MPSDKFYTVLNRSYTLLIAAALFSTGAMAASFTIAPEFLGDLREQRVLLAEKVKELDEVVKQSGVAQSDKRSATASIRRLETENDQARTKLEKLQGFDRDNPGTISHDLLRAAEEENKKAFRALKDAKDKKSLAESRINALNVDASTKYAEFLRLQKSFERDVNRVVDTQLQERLRVLQVKKEVSATDRVACGDDSIPVCKERSKKAAELKATEMGSVVFVNSLTEVKNFKLSREDLRSEVQATLSNKVFSNQRMVGETEYETTITANVEPVIGDQLSEQMASAIRYQVYDMVGGRIDFSQVQDPSHPSEGEADDTISAKPVKSTKKAAPEQAAAVEQEAPQEEAPVIAPTPRRLEKPTFTF